jgi:hypothetical protein
MPKKKKKVLQQQERVGGTKRYFKERELEKCSSQEKVQFI